MEPATRLDPASLKKFRTKYTMHIQKKLRFFKISAPAPESEPAGRLPYKVPKNYDSKSKIAYIEKAKTNQSTGWLPGAGPGTSA